MLKRVSDYVEMANFEGLNEEIVTKLVANLRKSVSMRPALACNIYIIATHSRSCQLGSFTIHPHPSLPVLTQVALDNILHHGELCG